MSGAVFLSYASQDAAPAQRICAALRVAGVEVWFDQSELRGGDAWDQKIRRQIRDCALFIAVISEHTQARPEGYFRLEWKLADDRTHLMAKGTPFLLPICIDQTRDWDAIVPDSFTTVQWTRLPGGETPAAFGERVNALLRGGSRPEARPAAEAPARGHGPGRGVKSTFARRWAAPILAALIAFAGVGLWQPWRRGSNSPPPSAAPPLSEADGLVARAQAQIDLAEATVDNAAVAEDLCRQAVELAPDSAHAWAVRAYIQSYYIQRTWDGSQKRLQDTQNFANRALALDPNEAIAMLSEATVLIKQGSDAQAEALLRRAFALRPDDARIGRRLGVAILGQGRYPDALANNQEVVRRFPKDPMALYDLGSTYMSANGGGDYETALRYYDATIAIKPISSAILYRALILVGSRGDLAGAQSTLDRLEPAVRGTDRAVSFAMWVGLLQGRLDRVTDAAALTANLYFNDVFFRGPKPMMVALAYRRAGKGALAALQWQSAEAVMRERLAQDSADVTDQLRLAVTLAWQGRGGEMAPRVAAAEAALRESPNRDIGLLLAEYCAGVGDSRRAVEYLRKVVGHRDITTAKTIPINPWWDPLHGSPEFEALLTELKTKGQSAALN